MSRGICLPFRNAYQKNLRTAQKTLAKMLKVFYNIYKKRTDATKGVLYVGE